MTITTTGGLFWLVLGLNFGIMHCDVLSNVGHGSIGSFDSMSIEWFVEGMFNGEGGVQCIKEFFSNVCGNIQREGRVKICFISCSCPLRFLACVILGLKFELKIISTCSQCFLVNWGC